LVYILRTMKKALITGITGQDGSYLTEFLLEKGYEVYGLVRRTSTNSFGRIQSFVDREKVKLFYGNMRDVGSIERAVEKIRPDEVYNLAAQSHVGISFDCPEEVYEVNYYGVGRLVNAVMQTNQNARIYQASTSEMFGSSAPPQNETSSFQPVSPYAKAKLKAHEDFVTGYREKHGIFVVSGILFNHESPRRGENFVTRKITLGLSRIKARKQNILKLGNLNAKRDWGFAGDYVKAMWMMLQQDKPEDYVIATGVVHSVRDFIHAAAKTLNMKIIWEGTGKDEVGKDEQGKVIVVIDPTFYRPIETNALIGDRSKAERILNWKPEIDFEALVRMMTEADYKMVS
jgi:GDPmannose 4,6-dehydratase